MLNKAMVAETTDRFFPTHILTVGKGSAGTGGTTCGFRRDKSFGGISPSTINGVLIQEVSSHDISSDSGIQNIWVQLDNSLYADYLYLVLEDKPYVVYKVPNYASYYAYQIEGSPAPSDGLFQKYVGKSISIYLSTEPPDF